MQQRGQRVAKVTTVTGWTINSYYFEWSLQRCTYGQRNTYLFGQRRCTEKIRNLLCTQNDSPVTARETSLLVELKKHACAITNKRLLGSASKIGLETQQTDP